MKDGNPCQGFTFEPKKNYEDLSGGTEHMLKMTFTLAAAIYVAFVVWGDPIDIAEDADEAAPIVVANTDAGFDQPVILTTNGSGEVDVSVTRAQTDVIVPDAAVIAASAPAPTGALGQPRLIGEPVVVSLYRPQAAPTEDATVEEEAAADEILLRVTGTRVNMRSAPSTSNRVVDSLPQGTIAEAMGPEQNGWIEIRDVATGRTGFMSARFLDPA